MPVNKDALIRFRIINTRLKSKFKPYPSLDELREACEEALGKPVSIRTLQNDLYNMRFDSELAYNAPIAYHATNKGYHYTEPTFSIDNIPLNTEDLYTLSFATSILNQFKDVQLMRPFKGIVDRIISSFEISRHLEQKDLEEVIEFETATQTRGTEYLGDLLEMIKGGYEVEIAYRSFQNNIPKQHIVHPYLLKEYKNRWYLIAWHSKRKAINTFGLDRIESINKTGKYFERIADFSAKNYFKDAFGITAPQRLKTRNVILSFSPAQGNYIRTQALHESQEIIKDNDEEFRIGLNVMLSYELKAQILSYGASVKVLKPKSLAKEIKAEIEAMKKNY